LTGNLPVSVNNTSVRRRRAAAETTLCTTAVHVSLSAVTWVV